MAINQDILNPNTNWEDQTKGYIEDNLKALLRAMLAVIENPTIAAGSVGVSQLTQALRDIIDGKVPNNRTINGKPLSGNVSLNANDVGALPADTHIPTKTSDLINDSGFITEGGSTTVPDDALSDSSENAVQNKVVKAAIDGLQNALNTLIGGNVQGAIDTFNEVKAFLDGIYTDDPTLASQLLALNNSITSLETALGTKANDNEVVKSISVNGQAQTPTNGNVNITVSGIKGDKGDKGDTGNVQVDGNGNVLIYNGRDMATPGAALDASQGQFLGKLLNVNDNAFYNVWVGTQQQLEALNGDYDENTIYIVGTVPDAVTRYSINKSGIGQHITVGGDNANDTSVREGNSFSLTLSPAIGYTIDSATGTMAGGGTLTKTENQDGSVTFSTSAVTGAITIQAVATKHITEIEVSAGTRNGNTIPLSATVEPTDADNVTLAWSISEDGTNYSNSTTHFSINSNGELTINEGANNASVTVKCADTNVDSGTAQGTLQLTGLTYEDTPIPTTAITGITASRTSANTLGLTLVKTPAGSNSVINYSLANVPYVMRLDSNGDPTYHPAATINSSTGEITYKAAAVYYAYDSVNDEYNYIPASGYDFALDVIATRSDDNTVTKTQTIQVTHNSGDVMWFEDLNVLRFIKNSATTDTPTENYTFADAASRTSFKPSATYKTLIERFIEFKYFGSTNLGPNASNHATFNGCSKLKCLGVPSGITKFETSVASDSPVYGCPLKEVHFADIGNYCGVTHQFNNTETFNGSFGTASIDETLGLGLYIDGEEKTELVIPSSVAAIKQFAFSGFNHITKLTLNYNGVVSGYNSFKGKNNNNTNNTTVNLLANIDLYVPSGQLASYQSNSYWSTAKSINPIPE